MPGNSMRVFAESRFDLLVRDQVLLEKIAWHRAQQRLKVEDAPWRAEERAERARKLWRAGFKTRGGDGHGG